MVKFSLYDSKHQAEEAYGRNKRQKTSALDTHVASIPLHERHDQFPSTASAINKGLHFKPKLELASELIQTISDKDLRYQMAASNYRGAKILRDSEYNYSYSKVKHTRVGMNRYLLDNDHLLNVLAEARHGYRSINSTTRNVMATARETIVGEQLRHQKYALEKERNRSKMPELPMGASFRTTEPNLPNVDTFRFNDMAIDQVPTFPQAVF